MRMHRSSEGTKEVDSVKDDKPARGRVSQGKVSWLVGFSADEGYQADFQELVDGGALLIGLYLNNLPEGYGGSIQTAIFIKPKPNKDKPVEEAPNAP